MKRFLRKKWHRIPVGIITAVLVLGLVAGGVFAAYSFTKIDALVTVDEPLQVQYKLDYVVHDTEAPGGRLDTSGWLDADGMEIAAFFSAGDAMTLYLRFNNRANSPLTVTTLMSGNISVFNYDLNDFPNGTIPASTGFDFGSGTVTDAAAAEWASGGIPISIAGDAPPGDHSLVITFDRS